MDDDDGLSDGSQCSPASGSSRLHWNLGFLEELTSNKDRLRLLRHRFPSKVGGIPAWLDPVDLPSRKQLTCLVTGQHMRFLLQLYAPVDHVPHAFHRTIMIFVSPAGTRLHESGCVRAFRCQLPRVNPFYPATPASAADKHPPPLNMAQQEVALSRDPWQVALQEGPQGPQEEQCPVGGPALYKTHELVVQAEPGSDSDLDDDSMAVDGGAGGAQRDRAANIQRLLSQYTSRIADEGELTEEDLPEGALDSVEAQLPPDLRHFADFTTQVSSAPDQCVRYCFEPGALPITPHLSPKPPPASAIPPCPRCGASRRFEFQVLPQLIHFLGEDAASPGTPDFGTIAVYSCAASCPATGGSVADALFSDAYMEEYVWVQPADGAALPQGPRTAARR